MGGIRIGRGGKVHAESRTDDAVTLCGRGAELVTPVAGDPDCASCVKIAAKEVAEAERVSRHFTDVVKGMQMIQGRYVETATVTATERAVGAVVSHEVNYWSELATREGCAVETCQTDSGSIRIAVQHPTIPTHTDTLLIYVSPARRGRIDTQTSIYRVPAPGARLKHKKITRRDARYMIEGMVSTPVTVTPVTATATATPVESDTGDMALPTGGSQRLILVVQSWRVGVANNGKPWHIIARRTDNNGASLNALCGTETGGETRAERISFEAFRMDGTRKRCDRCLMAHRRGGAYTVAASPTEATQGPTVIGGVGLYGTFGSYGTLYACVCGTQSGSHKRWCLVMGDAERAVTVQRQTRGYADGDTHNCATCGPGTSAQCGWCYPIDGRDLRTIPSREAVEATPGTVSVGTMLRRSDGGTYQVTRADAHWVGLLEIATGDGLSIRADTFASLLAEGGYAAEAELWFNDVTGEITTPDIMAQREANAAAAGKLHAGTWHIFDGHLAPVSAPAMATVVPWKTRTGKRKGCRR